MGYGKPLVDPEAPVPPTEKPEMKLRQAPCDKMVGYIISTLFTLPDNI
jgi:hypothetical protein